MPYAIIRPQCVNTLRPRQDGRHFPDDIFKRIFLNEIIWILIKISLNFVPSGPINNISALVQIMAWRRPGDKPLSEPMMVSLLMHICVTRPQWVKIRFYTDKLIVTGPLVSERMSLRNQCIMGNVRSDWNMILFYWMFGFCRLALIWWLVVWLMHRDLTSRKY